MAITPVPGDNSCNGCKHKKVTDSYSSDGWDRMEDWECSHGNAPSNRKIEGAIDWYDEKKVKTPEWCPLYKARGQSLGRDLGITDPTIGETIEYLQEQLHKAMCIPPSYLGSSIGPTEKE